MGLCGSRRDKYFKEPVVNPQVYRENRAQFPLAELMKHRGRWVAFSPDGRRIIASSEDLVALDNLIVAEGENPEHVAIPGVPGTGEQPDV